MYVLCIINNVYHSEFCSKDSYDANQVKEVQNMVLEMPSNSKCNSQIKLLKDTCEKCSLAFSKELFGGL